MQKQARTAAADWIRARMAADIFFAFDLDSTVTQAEILPTIAGKAGLCEEMARLTAMTLDGILDFETSFGRRFDLLRHVPVPVVQQIVAAVPLDPHITAFIAENRGSCAIVTGNLDCWIQPITARLGCAVYCSQSEIRDGALSLVRVLDKGEAVRAIARKGCRVIAVGDAANDIPMFREASMGIAFGGVREPAPGLVAVADRVERDAATLCGLLRGLRGRSASSLDT